MNQERFLIITFTKNTDSVLQSLKTCLKSNDTVPLNLGTVVGRADRTGQRVGTVGVAVLLRRVHHVSDLGHSKSISKGSILQEAQVYTVPYLKVLSSEN